MRRPPRPAAVAALSALAALAAAGCSEIIGLGPEPSPAGETPGNLYPCGLAPHPNEACNECAQTACCAETQACADEAGCADEASCAVACAYDVVCISGCTATYGTAAYTRLQSCQVSGCIALCFPAPNTACNKLIGCCSKVPAGTAREVCTGAVNENNEQGCLDVIETAVLSSYCPELTP
jgi:hypothetical protein